MNKIIGNEGEAFAVEYLIHKGFEIIERNYRIREGEIDIIAKTENKIIFVEVKTLPHTQLEDLDMIINKKKQEKIIKTAKQFIQTHRQYSQLLMSLDVIVLRLNPFIMTYSDLIHIDNAFGENYA